MWFLSYEYWLIVWSARARFKRCFKDKIPFEREILLTGSITTEVLLLLERKMICDFIIGFKAKSHPIYMEKYWPNFIHDPEMLYIISNSYYKNCMSCVKIWCLIVYSYSESYGTKKQVWDIDVMKFCLKLDIDLTPSCIWFDTNFQIWFWYWYWFVTNFQISPQKKFVSGREEGEPRRLSCLL